MKKMLMASLAFLTITTSAFAHISETTVVCDYAAVIYNETNEGLNATFANVLLPSKLGNLEDGFSYAENVEIKAGNNVYTLTYPTPNGSVTLDIEKTQYTVTEIVFGQKAQEVRKCHPALNGLFK